MTDCRTCTYGGSCGVDDEGDSVYPREDCLENNAEGKYSYKHYVEGDPRLRYNELRNSGAINIVIGGEGEHELNVKWDIHEAYKKLAHVCENCGGLVTHRTTFSLELMKPYDGLWWIEWMHGKLYSITRVIQKEYWTAP